MSRTLLVRLQAAGLHVLGSVLVLGLFLGLVYGFWYPAPYPIVFSTFDVVKILIGVDVVLGPLLTLIVFNIAKPRKELLRDMGFILAVQLSALIWGVYVTYSVRPQYLAFVGSSVYAVTGNDINLNELSADVKRRAWYEPPVPVSVRGPQSQEEWGQHMADLYNNKVPDLMYQTRRYRSYTERVIHSKVPPLTAEALSGQSEAVRTWLASVQSMEGADEFAFYNIMSGTFTSLAAVRNEDGVLMSVMPVQSTPPPKNKP